MEDEKGMVWVDCRKTFAVVEEWDISGKRLKELGPANLLQRITGTVDGAKLDFARVQRGTLQKFADGCGRPVKDFYPVKTELDQWRKEQANKSRASKDRRAAANDAGMLEHLHNQICGFYELYHHATSKNEAGKVSIALLHVNGFDANRGAIRCELHDSRDPIAYFHLIGHVRVVLGFLDWSLGFTQDQIVCHGFSYLPVGEKNPGFTLYGIFLVLSGDGKLDYPIAARGGLRFLGESASEAIQNSVIDFKQAEGEADNLLKKSVGGYLNDLQERKLLRLDVLARIETEILPRLNNTISADAAPRALIVPR